MSEKIYDEEISPLVTQLIDACEKHKMPFFMNFEYSHGEFCRSGRRRLGDSVLFVFLDHLSQCVTDDGGVDIDKFFLSIVKRAKSTGHNSIMMDFLGVPTLSGRDG